MINCVPSKYVYTYSVEISNLKRKDICIAIPVNPIPFQNLLKTPVQTN